MGVGVWDLGVGVWVSGFEVYSVKATFGWSALVWGVQGHFAHKKTPNPLKTT